MPSPPSLGAVTSSWGLRRHPITGVWRFHYGEDTIGDGNYAPVTGTVVFAGYDTTGHGFGLVVGIRWADRPDYIWWTAHHAKLAVTVGQKVTQRRTRTGPMGHTGAATGDHAHQEVRVGGTARPGSGTAVNPRTLYGGGGGSGGGIDEEEGTMKIAIVKFDQEGGDGAYHQFLIGADCYQELGPIGLDALRDGNPKHGGPLGQEFDWKWREFEIFTRGKRDLNKPPAPPATLPPIDLDALAAALALIVPKPPTADEVAAKVIEHQKLPGN